METAAVPQVATAACDAELSGLGGISCRPRLLRRLPEIIRDYLGSFGIIGDITGVAGSRCP